MILSCCEITMDLNHYVYYVYYIQRVASTVIE